MTTVPANDEQERFKTHSLLQDMGSSKITKYGRMIVGSTRLWKIVGFELIMLLCSRLPGMLGLFLRGKLYPLLLGQVGKNVVFGCNVSLRHPHKISIGDHVIIDDNCLLDAKGNDNQGITIGNNVFVGRNSILSCKDGDILLHDGVNIGFNCNIASSSIIEVGADTMLAAYCYLVAGGNYGMDDLDTPIAYQEPFRSLGGIRVGPDGWLGAGVTVVDGITIGQGAVIGAGGVVLKDVPDFCVAVGVPAKVIRDRRAKSGSQVNSAEPRTATNSEDIETVQTHSHGGSTPNGT